MGNLGSLWSSLKSEHCPFWEKKERQTNPQAKEDRGIIKRGPVFSEGWSKPWPEPQASFSLKADPDLGQAGPSVSPHLTPLSVTAQGSR